MAGFSADERAAMKARADELRAEGKKGAKKADGLQACLDAIAKMADADRAIVDWTPAGERQVIDLVTRAATG